MSYGSGHETSHLCSYALKRRAQGAGGRPTILRCLRLAPIPDPSSQLKGRASAPDSQKPRVWLANRAQRAIHAFFNGRGLGALTTPGSSRPKEVHAAAFGEEGAEILLRDLLHRRSPREFGKQTSL